MSNSIINSQISDSAKLYDSIRCVNSIIGENCTIGDGCDVVGGVLNDRTELGRRNVIKNVTMGQGSYTGTNTIIQYADIGKYCSISWNVSIAGIDHDYRCTSMYTDYWFKRTFGIDPKRPSRTGRTQIGNDVWIASGVIILNGLMIGDGAVIGAGAVVVDDVPPYSVVAGTPGRVIKKRFDDETIEKMEELKWWDWDDEKIRRNIAFLSGEPDFSLIVP